MNKKETGVILIILKMENYIMAIFTRSVLTLLINMKTYLLQNC